VPPAIRALCAGLDAGRAVPHVIAGLESVLFLPCPGTKGLEGDQTMQEGQSAEAGMKGKMPALIAAILSFAIARLTGMETDAKEYNQRVKRAIALLRDVREDEAMVEKIGEGQEEWEGWEVVTKKDVDAWLREIGSKGWLRMDWWENMAQGSGVSGQVEEGYVEDEDNDEQARAAERERERLWKTRSGTMKQDQFDYLSEAKREQFARWKELMLVKMDNLVEGGAVDHGLDIADG
jgi:origin recognition complex subunit 6